jgi:hypothetical protein
VRVDGEVGSEGRRIKELRDVRVEGESRKKFIVEEIDPKWFREVWWGTRMDNPVVIIPEVELWTDEGLE